MALTWRELLNQLALHAPPDARVEVCGGDRSTHGFEISRAWVEDDDGPLVILRTTHDDEEDLANAPDPSEEALRKALQERP
jgi:hypothetical protein